MATFVLIHGAGSDAWLWHRVTPRLEAAGHDVVAPSLPCDDDGAGLAEYTQTVVDAVGDRRDLIVVGQSLGGFTAPLVVDRIGARLLVLLAAMTPAPGEPPGEWGANTGWKAARAEQAQRLGRTDEMDLEWDFFDDLPPDVYAELMARGERGQSGTPMEKPWPLDRWPDVPTRFLLASDDHFFPADFQRRVARERLGIEADETPGGHLAALSRPVELADRLLAYEAETATT
jgi:pimeloyl-ACP methyl ester carboxylesterase